MANNLKQQDANQVIRSIYDPDQNRIRVDAQISAQIGQVEVILDQTEDSVSLGDGTNLFTSTTIGSDIGLDVNIINADLDIRDLVHTQDSISLGDGTNLFTSTTIGPDTLINVKKVEDPTYYTRVETVNSSLSYTGKTYDLNAATSDAVWQISRQLRLGNELITQYADDVSTFNKVWDDRTTYFATPVLDNPASLLFDGVDEYITLGDNYTFGPATAFSWSFWMKANNFAAQRAFIAKTSQDANVYGYSFQHNSSGQLFAQFRAPASLTSTTFSTALTSGIWYHICFTYAGGSNINGIRAYINASVEPAPSSATLNAWTVTDPLVFAARGNTFNFSGNMNQISVWNKALSQSEVTELYNSGSPGDLNSHSAIANLLSWWYLNDDSNFPTEIDNIGSINGTLVNMEVGDYDTGDVP